MIAKQTRTCDERNLPAEITRRVLSVMRPHKIILFGSRANGRGGAGSDWDILVVADSDKPRYQRSPPLYGALSDLRQPVDILVYTPEEIEEWSQVESAFVTTAVRGGRVLYEDKKSFVVGRLPEEFRV